MNSLVDMSRWPLTLISFSSSLLSPNSNLRIYFPSQLQVWVRSWNWNLNNGMSTSSSVGRGFRAEAVGKKSSSVSVLAAPAHDKEFEMLSWGYAACRKAKKVRGFNGKNGIQGVFPGFGSWPIKAFRPSAAFLESGDSVVEPYMGDVDMLEEEELPAQYVSPPPIPLEDVEMRDKVEEVMYTLLKCVPGPMMTLLYDQEKWDTLIKIFSETVEIQDPLVCLKGVHSCKRLLNVLCQSGITVNLHEVYYENIATDRFKRWVYAVWTATLTNNLQESIEQSGMDEWWEIAYGSLEGHIPKRQDEHKSAYAAEYEQERKTHYMNDENSVYVKSARRRILKLSGESKLELNKKGEVTSVCSRWYKLTEDDERELVTSKLWLAGLYSLNDL